MRMDRSRPPRDGDVALWLSSVINDAMKDAREAGLSPEEAWTIVSSYARSADPTGQGRVQRPISDLDDPYADPEARPPRGRS